MFNGSGNRSTERLLRDTILKDYHPHDREILPTNNYAEQTIRIAVLLRKGGFSNRS